MDTERNIDPPPPPRPSHFLGGASIYGLGSHLTAGAQFSYQGILVAILRASLVGLGGGLVLRCVLLAAGAPGPSSVGVAGRPCHWAHWGGGGPSSYEKNKAGGWYNHGGSSSISGVGGVEGVRQPQGVHMASSSKGG